MELKPNSSKKIGLYGGTFDPVHFGHLNLAIEMLEKHQLDEIWFIPAGINPLKKTSFAPPEHRLAMLNLGIGSFSKFKILENEIHKMGPSYTIDTLLEIKKNNPNNSYYLILGDDVIQNFEKWHVPAEIIKYSDLLVGSREIIDEIPIKSPEIAAAIKKGLTKTRLLSISSTDLRSRLCKNLYCRHLVPAEVLDYIYQHQLYSLSLE